MTNKSLMLITNREYKALYIKVPHDTFFSCFVKDIAQADATSGRSFVIKTQNFDCTNKLGRRQQSVN